MNRRGEGELLFLAVIGIAGIWVINSLSATSYSDCESACYDVVKEQYLENYTCMKVRSLQDTTGRWYNEKYPDTCQQYNRQAIKEDCFNQCKTKQ